MSQIEMENQLCSQIEVKSKDETEVLVGIEGVSLVVDHPQIFGKILGNQIVMPLDIAYEFSELVHLLEFDLRILEDEAPLPGTKFIREPNGSTFYINFARFMNDDVSRIALVVDQYRDDSPIPIARIVIVELFRFSQGLSEMVENLSNRLYTAEELVHRGCRKIVRNGRAAVLYNTNLSGSWMYIGRTDHRPEEMIFDPYLVKLIMARSEKQSNESKTSEMQKMADYLLQKYSNWYTGLDVDRDVAILYDALEIRWVKLCQKFRIDNCSGEEKIVLKDEDRWYEA